MAGVSGRSLQIRVEEEEVGIGVGGRGRQRSALIQLPGGATELGGQSGAAEEARSALELQRLVGEEAQCAVVLGRCGGARELEGVATDTLEARAAQCSGWSGVATSASFAEVSGVGMAVGGCCCCCGRGRKHKGGPTVVPEARAALGRQRSSRPISTTFAENFDRARGQGEALLLQRGAGASCGEEEELSRGSGGTARAWNTERASTQTCHRRGRQSPRRSSKSG